jgi:hypothetical protein
LPAEDLERTEADVPDRQSPSRGDGGNDIGAQKEQKEVVVDEPSGMGERIRST